MFEGNAVKLKYVLEYFNVWEMDGRHSSQLFFLYDGM
jgi:hypothetical protein